MAHVGIAVLLSAGDEPSDSERLEPNGTNPKDP